MTKVINFPIEFEFVLPIFGQHMLSSEYPTRHAQLEIRGMARVDGDSIEYFHTSITPHGNEDAIKDFYDEMKGKPDNETALHIATMNHLRYDLRGDMSNVLIVDDFIKDPIPSFNHFSL